MEVMMISNFLMIKMMCILMTCWFIPKLTHAATKRDYYTLYDYLFEPSFYKANVRPAVNESHPITVKVYINLNSLIEIDEKEQVLFTTATSLFEWEDNYLSWNQTEYGGIVSMLVPQKNIYLPDVIVSNSVRNAEQLGFPQQQARLGYEGDITWEPNLLLTTACDIDITYFPFDTQICYIDFTTAVSRMNEIRLTMDRASNDIPFSFDDFGANGQWDVVDTSAEELIVEKTKPILRYGLKLKRRRVFYLLNIVLPVFFLSLTASLVFALPAEEGEKMGTGITVLLAFAVYLTIVSDLVPNTSLQVSILGLYLTTLLGMCAISVVVGVFILRLHFREENTPVGPKIAKIIRLLQKMTCSKKTVEVATNKVAPEDRETTETDAQSKDTSDTDGNSSNGISTSNIFMGKDDLSWKQVAKTLDEFCFILFSALSILITLICLLVLSVGGEFWAPKLKGHT